MSNRTFYASTYVVADGVTRTWPFSFAGVNTGQNSGVTPYLYPEDVKVQELYTDADGNRQTVQRTGVLNAPNQITIDGPAIIAGREIRIYRETELRFPLVDYRDLQSVSEHDLDLANRQAVFIAQETRDTASANLVYDKQGHFNAGGRRVVNMAPGIDARDAVNMDQYQHTIRSPATDVYLNPIPATHLRLGKLLAFDPVTGQPMLTLPASDSSTALRAELTAPLPGKGSDVVAHGTSTVGAELRLTVKSPAQFFLSDVVYPAGVRVMARSGEAWDIVARNTGEFNHPVAGYGIIVVARPNAALTASSYDVHRSKTPEYNHAQLSLAIAKLKTADVGVLEMPYATAASPLRVAGSLAIPDNRMCRGTSWNTCVLMFTTPTGGMTLGSGTILMDMDVRGGKVAQIGIVERGEYNRASIQRVRIQDFTKWNLAVGMNGAANNSLFYDIQMKFAGVANLAVGQALNCTFLQTNGDLDAASGPNARGIRVYDLFPGSGDSNKQCRNTKFIKGIYERGVSEYQLEVERATGISFDGTEFNNGSIATGIIHKGTLQMAAPFFSLNGTNLAFIAMPGTDVRISAPQISGSGGRSFPTLFRGSIIMDGSIASPSLRANMRYYRAGVSGVTETTTDPIMGTRIHSTSGSGANRAQVYTAAGYSLDGYPRCYKVEITVSKIEAGTVSAYLQLAAAPNRVLLGELKVGYNVFSLVTDKAANGSIDFVGLAAFDITLLSVETVSY